MEKLYKILAISFLIWAILSTTGMAYYFSLSLSYRRELNTVTYKLERYRNIIGKLNQTLITLNKTLNAINQSYSILLKQYTRTIKILERKLNMSTVILVIDYGNGTKEIKKVNFISGVNDTVFDILKSVAKINYTYYESYGDVLITCINGLCSKQIDSNSGYYWLFYIDFKLSQTGAMHTKVSDGDIIVWNYTKVSW